MPIRVAVLDWLDAPLLRNDGAYVVAVSDIHGCATELAELLKEMGQASRLVEQRARSGGSRSGTGSTSPGRPSA